MTASVVLLFENGKHLYLTDVKRSSDGTVKSGYVVNGNWRYQRKGNEILAKDDDNHIVTRVQCSTVPREVVVPKDLDGHYIDVLNWAVRTTS